MFIAKVYKIAVIPFSGIMEEIFAAKHTIQQWNEANAERAGKLFLIANDPLSTDILVGIIGNRIENKEIIENHLNAGKKVLLFFNVYADPNNTISNEQNQVALFKNAIKDRCTCSNYSVANELESVLNKQLEEIQL